MSMKSEQGWCVKSWQWGKNRHCLARGQGNIVNNKNNNFCLQLLSPTVEWQFFWVHLRPATKSTSKSLLTYHKRYSVPKKSDVALLFSFLFTRCFRNSSGGATEWASLNISVLIVESLIAWTAASRMWNPCGAIICAPL